MFGYMFGRQFALMFGDVDGSAPGSFGDDATPGNRVPLMLVTALNRALRGGRRRGR